MSEGPMMNLILALAAGSIPEPSSAPYFLVNDQASAEALPLKETRAKVSIAGVIAHVRVTQVYTNEGAQPIEAVYVFPGSTRSAVFGLEMRIAESEKARAKYEQAKQEGKSASLLEQHRPNVFQMNVANILPGDRIEVILDYTELLVPSGGVYELVYPTVVGPRYVGQGDGSSGWVSNPTLASGQKPPYEWSLSARISGGMAVGAVKSPTHAISPRFDGGVVDVEVLEPAGGDRDFVLQYRLDGDAIETGMLVYESGGEKYFAAILQPPKAIAPSMIPPREYVFIVDVSGSMSGFPIATAKALVGRMIRSLRPEDRFNVVLFAGGSTVMSDASVRATKKNIDRAIAVIDREHGGGGTEMLPAIDRALSMPRAAGMSPTLVVITDGYVTVEKELFTRIRAKLGEANLFAFGIGSSVNHHLIEGMARQGMGEAFVVLDQGEADRAAERFRRSIESPVLTDITVAFDGFEAYDVEPEHVPDVFSERPIVVMGKYRGMADGAIRISGATGNGSFQTSLSVASAAPSDDLVALRYLWARDRIGRLSDFATAGEDHRDAITALGLEHHLMTAYTSFVAVDHVVRNIDGKRTTVRQPIPLPAGVSESAIPGDAYGYATGLGGLGTRGTGSGGGGLGIMGGHAIGRLGGGDLGGRGKSAIRVVPGKTVIMGSLDKEVIGRAIRRNLARVRYCYEKELTKDPALAGKVAVRFRIGPEGDVLDAQIAESTLGNAAVEECILRVMRTLKLPKPHGGGTVIVTYPFVFSST
jgi:Ca-activated chloride channel family protein